MKYSPDLKENRSRQKESPMNLKVGRLKLWHLRERNEKIEVGQEQHKGLWAP
jgi:hypothetical protein